MRIKINQIAKLEGSVGMEAKIIDGKIEETRIDVKEGARLIEGILKGRKISEAPIITSRICGVCPVTHGLASVKAIETALDLKIPEPVIILRKLMQYGQIIQSHILHIFFLAISDYFDLENSLDLSKIHPKKFKDVLKIRDFANKIITVIGGRTTHPISNIIGGFSKAPDRKELKNLLRDWGEILEAALRVTDLFKKIEFPKFKRTTEFIALKNKNEYAIYEGDIVSTKGLHILKKNYLFEFKEFQRPNKTLNLVRHEEAPYMLGALARLNLSADQLNKEAKKTIKKLKIDLPNYNLFYNLPAQMIEVIHFIEETEKLLKIVLGIKIKKSKITFQYPPTKFPTVAGGNIEFLNLNAPKQGVGTIEAPRGTLFHSYKIDKDNQILKAKIITPTAQFLLNLEKDLEAYIPTLKNLTAKERQQKIKILVRAYDLCISCAVH